MHNLQSICFLLDLILMLWGALCSGSSVVSGRSGGSVVLECGHDPGGTFLQITWKIDLYNSTCKASMNKQEARVANQCNTRARMELNHRSLTVNNIELSDEGTYRCEIVNAFATFFNEITLKVFAQPSMSLEINSAGFPECRASGGSPAAEISWIPQYDNINTTSVREVDRTWTVISIFGMQNVTMVRCLVAHPTLENLQEKSITLTAQPSVTLEINSGGTPECTAHGAYPPAEISWIPHTDKITTNHFQYPNKTWTVISRYNLKNVTMVTCRVSHPAFTNPQEKCIVLHGTEGKHLGWKMFAYIIFPVVTFTLFIFMMIKTKTQCCQKEPGELHHTKVIEIPLTSEEVTDSRF